MFILLFIFIIGLVIGSFLNVVVLRLGTGERISSGRSRCFSCSRELGAGELIPLFSFLAQNGRCRGCRTKISWQYPLVELGTALLFVLVGMQVLLKSQIPMADDQGKVWDFWFYDLVGLWGLNLGVLVPFIYWAAIFSFLLAISVYDIRHKIIPSQLVYSFIVLSLFAPFVGTGWPDNITTSQVVISHLLAGFGGFFFFAALWFISNGRWMGFGDAKLALGMGFFLGFPGIAAGVIFAFWLGTLAALPLLLSKNLGLKAKIPFAPFLAGGAVLSWLLSGWISQFYYLLTL